MIQSTILLKQCLSYIRLEFLVYHLILRLKKKNSHNHNYKVYTCIPHITDRKVKLQDGRQIIQAEICFSFIGFPEGSAAEESTSNVVDIEDIGFVSGLERSCGEGNCNSLRYSCPQKLWPQRVGYNWACMNIIKNAELRDNWHCLHDLTKLD